MVNIWKALRRRALLKKCSDTQLAEYLECFSAGYNRGVHDVSQSVRRKVWVPLIDTISQQLVVNRSVLEAGCWRVGLDYGREDAIAGIAKDTDRLIRHFRDAWETGSIADQALECAPASVEIRKTLAALLLRHEIPVINFHLRNTDLSLLEMTWDQEVKDTESLVFVASGPAQQAQGRGK
jgi:hypothetical protein